MDCQIVKTIQAEQFVRLGRVHSGQPWLKKSRKDFFNHLLEIFPEIKGGRG